MVIVRLRIPSRATIANKYTCRERGDIADGDCVLLKKFRRYRSLVFSAAAVPKSHEQAAREIRTFCFAKTMEKVPHVRTAPQFIKVREIQTLRYEFA